MRYFLYVYSLGIVLNLYSYLTKIKGSNCYSPFLLFKIIIWILGFNIFFEILKKIYNVNFNNISFIFVIFIICILMNFLNKKYACISFGGIISYFILTFLNLPISLKEIAFLIGAIHIFEGIFVIFQKDFFRVDGKIGILKFYLPLILNRIPIIFLVFYRRNFINKDVFYTRVISGMLIFFYGIIILLIGSFIKNVYVLILSSILHEGILFLEDKLYKFLRKDMEHGEI